MIIKGGREGHYIGLLVIWLQTYNELFANRFMYSSSGLGRPVLVETSGSNPTYITKGSKNSCLTC